MNLEGKKGHLEGTWRAVVGHLEGKGESLQSHSTCHSTAILSVTWRVFGKSIYTDHHRKTECHNGTSLKCSSSAALQRSYTDTIYLSPFTEMPIIGVEVPL